MSVVIDFISFIWPQVCIGPSPNAGFRRVYPGTRNQTKHLPTTFMIQNYYLCYADFTTQMIEDGTPLPWMYNTIPVLNDWRVDAINSRFPYCSFLAGDDGGLYYIGYHDAFDAMVVFWMRTA